MDQPMKAMNQEWVEGTREIVACWNNHFILWKNPGDHDLAGLYDDFYSCLTEIYDIFRV